MTSLTTSPVTPGKLLITPDCLRCQLCVELCPVEALTFEQGHLVVGRACQLCLACLEVCPVGAILFVGEE